MNFRGLVLLTLVGSLFLESGLGQRGENDWMKAQEKLIARLQNEQKDAEQQQQSNLDSLEVRLNATVDELRRQRVEVETLKKEKQDLLIRLISSEQEIQKLKQFVEKVGPRVAFSASLASSGEIYKGPSADKTLIFRRIFSNVGNAYDPNTGVFTAPANGFYYFTYSTYGYSTHITGAILIKNAMRQVSTFDSPSTDGSDSGSNAAVLQLSTGDKVHVELWDNGQVFDNLNGHTTFSGFFLFSL